MKAHTLYDALAALKAAEDVGIAALGTPVWTQVMCARVDLRAALIVAGLEVPVRAATQPAHAQPRECACFAGVCHCEVVDGRTPTGLHCKAHMAETLRADAS